MVFAVWACPEPLAEGLARARGRAGLVGAARARRAGAARATRRRALRLSGRLPRALLREAPLPLRAARARRPLHVPRARPRRRPARDGAGAPLRPDDGSRRSHERRRRTSTVDRDPRPRPLRRAHHDDDAVELLRSRDLVAVGRAANEMRNRLHDPERVTFIIDRNLNYTNVCVTDCDFCAFYRRPGDRARATSCRSPSSSRRSRRRSRSAAPACSCRAATIPTSASTTTRISSRSIKARYPIHLHALSPSEIVHAARRSKLTVPETLDADARRRARLDPRRRRRDPRRPRARHHRAEEGRTRRSGSA